MIRPTVLLDLDGPLADFDLAGFTRCYEVGIRFDVAGPWEQTERYFTDHIPDREFRKLARRMVDEAGWFADLPVTPGAVEGVEALMSEADVWVCTKPLRTNPTCASDKAAWLKRHFPALDDRLIVAPNKAMIVGDVLWDDAPKRRWIPTAPWGPIIFAAPFNGPESEWGGIRRCGWDDVSEVLRVAKYNARLREAGL